MQSSGIKFNPDRTDLQGDQAAWGLKTSPTLYTSDNGIEALFNGGSYPMRVVLGNSPVLNSPATHLPILIRLSESKPEVSSVNMAMDFKANADYCCEQPTAYSLEGSADGNDWILLTEDNAVNLPAVANGKIYQTAREFDVPARTVADRSFANPVSVSLGANVTLRAEYVGEVEPIKISSLKVDAAGGSSCNGFVFAENGILDVVNVTESDENGRFVAVDVPDGSGWTNLKNWAITVNGKPAGGKFKVAVVENGLRIFEPGLVFVVR